jgi:predicted DNA-binding transcriptional regulator AlpA
MSSVRSRSAEDEAESRFLSKREVLDRVGVSYVTLWSWIRAGDFPHGRIVGQKTKWLAAEVTDWISSRPIRRVKGDDPGRP